ncbi:type III secretion system chaperone [Variovorax sp. RA8]|uniref:type III secretion system chaperone n=1 Tax=Variovorax sp. (strain JCM 16519 / RA8) TaxID=662548 RepID=UPI000A479C3D|nr:type III secretion system chaperone [Variovorax sp. RA8]VTU20641.1 hypothetical protein RA8CHR_02173 [Variovorax sp. RA8]
MSAIESLLGPDPGAHAGEPARTPRTLLVDTDVLIHLQEDESREEVTLYSVPGSMQEVAWLSERTEAWSHVLPHPAQEQSVCTLTVNHETREVFLSETWPRAALDQVTLGEELNTHAERHRLWRRMLLVPQDGGVEPSPSLL